MKLCFAIATLALELFAYNRCAFANKEIVELKTLSRFEQRVKAGSILIFDLHGTIAEARDNAGLGSDAWVNRMSQDGVDFGLVCNLWGQLQRRVELSLVEPSFVRQFQYLKQRFKVLVLTGGLSSLAERYVQQLANIDIDIRFGKLSRSADLRLPTKNGESTELVRMRDGLLAIGPNISKADAIQFLLTQLQLSDHPIVVIDDRRDYLEEIAAKLNDLDIMLLHYTASTLAAEYVHEHAQLYLRKLITSGAVKIPEGCETNF